MRLNLTGDIFMTTAFDPRMVLHNSNSSSSGHSRYPNSFEGSSHNNNNSNSHSNSNSNEFVNVNGSINNNNSSEYITYTGNIMGHQRPVIDLLVGMVAVPLMILCALQLEKNIHDMANSPESRWVVFGLGIGMLLISIMICGYITHRMGVCIWTGPIDEFGNRTDGPNNLHINSQNDILRIVDTMPPSYDSVVKFDIPPPPYDCLVIDMDDCKDESQQTATNNINNNNSSTNTNTTCSLPATTPSTGTRSMQRIQLDKIVLPIEASCMHI